MSFFDSLTKVVQIDDKNTITLRALTWGEEQAIKQKCMTVSADQSGTANAAIDPIEIELMTFRLAIIAWSGPGFDDRPVTHENIAALPGWIVEKLREPYNDLSTLSEEEKKP